MTAVITKTQAQEFGGNPPSIKWQQVNIPAAKVIFPSGLDSAALRVANIIQQMNKAIQPTIGYKQKPISIILQNQTTISNAYVGLAPFRSEFYLTPEQNSFEVGSLFWPDQLAIHEFRHVQQYNNFNVGLSHLLKVLFGEGGQALSNDLAIPNWFFEGDAVFNETYISEQGRGRLPFFFNGYRALWAADRSYSFMKLRNGSYQDYIPDWYPLGYMLVSYGREKYGGDFWKKVTHDAAAYTGGLYPMQKAIKKYSGHDFVQFRNAGLNFYKNQFALHQSTVNSTVNKHQHFRASKEYPAYLNDSTMIYMKTTYDHLPMFIIKTGDHEKKISVRDISLDNYFAYHDGKILYAAYRPDIRWNYRDYSELMLLDVNTGKEKRLTRKTKYFSPDFCADGKTIVTVQEGTNGKSELHLLHATDGKLIRIIPNKEDLFYTYPKFYGDNRLMSAVRDKKGKMSVAMIDVNTGIAKYLIPFSYRPVAFPVIKNDTLYFSETSGNDDRLFALSLKNPALYKLKNYNLNNSIGNYQVTLSPNKLAWSGFTAFGYQVNELAKKELQWELINEQIIQNKLPDFGITALKSSTSANLLATVHGNAFPITRYSKTYQLLNFHSLIPNFNDPNYTLSLAGENVLNTLQSNLSFNYNRDEGYKQFGFDAIYGALFPYLSGGAGYTLNRRSYFKSNHIYWNETNVHAGLELPLNLTAGKLSTLLHIGSDLFYTKAAFRPAYQRLFANRSYTYSNNYIIFSNTIQKAKQNIYPRLGQSISINYKSAISGINADQFLASGAFYFPGFKLNHNLVITAAHQQKDKNNVIN